MSNVIEYCLRVWDRGVFVWRLPIHWTSRFMNRRGAVRQLRCDQGANFIGARNELKTALSEMNQDHFQENVLRNKCERIPFKFNAPHCSHKGGPWERFIRTVRNALEPLMMKPTRWLMETNSMMKLREHL